MLNIKRQIYSILTITVLSRFLIAGSAWVALLSARGFSMIEIGIAESCFHMASLLFEIPSGIISDVFGRKRSMVLSQCMFILSAVLMIFSDSLAGVCVSLVFDAFGYNFSSGSREALAYDSLKTAGYEDRYLEFTSLDLSVYRLSNAVSILCAGLALILGYRLAYLIDIAVLSVCLIFSIRLQEVSPDESQFKGNVSERLIRTFRESIRFLTHNFRSIALMLFNSTAGATATLTVFFMQAQLPLAGLSDVLFGPALFFLTLGGAVGARLSVKAADMDYKKISVFCIAGTIFGAATAFSGMPLLMCIGGFTANMCGDLLQTRTDVKLNERFPSSQRATLVSVSSLCFSVVMIILSPIAGYIFS